VSKKAAALSLIIICGLYCGDSLVVLILLFNACGGCFSGAPKLGVLELVQSNLSALVRTCLLYGGRSTAHKVARLLALCLEYVFYRACRVMVCTVVETHVSLMLYLLCSLLVKLG